ncbi:ABC-2 type transport system permease protein [Natronobacillus azotifigens]|uniref:ABC transporter permease n=1 Tax=Natronobacillus azotifigens TaxID=472978 RepID=A0A9J6RCQ0_9BACI|nr:ABC transporter permease [Natronobacillus azotifigens]MCZ0703319.1 ABC transporter permease [Natronobacillus azotifigens]
MRKFWIVLSHSYLTRLKSKSFMITTALFLLFILLMANFQTIIDLFDQDSQLDRVAVIDQSDELFAILDEQIDQGDYNFELARYDGTLEDAEQAVLDGEYIGVLELEVDAEQLPVASYHTDQLSNQSVQYQLESQLQQIKVAIATNQAGIDQEVLESIYQPVPFETVAIAQADGTTSRTEEEISGARGLVYVILFLLYFAVITYGNMIAMDIANEKSSRVMEILISSSSPIGQMFAKISGIALLGLTQIGIFLLAGYFVIQSKQEELVGGFFEAFGFTDIPASTYVYAVVFFLLGYLLYATLSAMLGSLVSRMEDVNQLMMPVILLVVAAFMIAMIGLSTPEANFVTVTSYIPFFTPLVMFLRVGLLEVPTWEIAISIGIMIATIILLALIGAKVYRGGVLMYGRGVSLKDFKQALQLSKKE